MDLALLFQGSWSGVSLKGNTIIYHLSAFHWIAIEARFSKYFEVTGI